MTLDGGEAGTWVPSDGARSETHLGRLMAAHGCDFDALHAWSVRDPEAYWAVVIDALGLRFETPPQRVLGLSEAGQASWLPGASYNVVAACFEGRDPDGLALVRGCGDGTLEVLSLIHI